MLESRLITSIYSVHCLILFVYLHVVSQSRVFVCFFTSIMSMHPTFILYLYNYHLGSSCILGLAPTQHISRHFPRLYWCMFFLGPRRDGSKHFLRYYLDHVQLHHLTSMNHPNLKSFCSIKIQDSVEFCFLLSIPNHSLFPHLPGEGC